MGVFSQITETFSHLLTEKFLNGLRIITGNEEGRPENRPDAPVSTATPDNESPNTAPIRENAKTRLSSSRLGWYGNR